jgi:hypothetical protein
LQKRGQLFIGTNDETVSVVAMCVSNPDGSPASIIPLPKYRIIRHNSPNIETHDQGRRKSLPVS